MKKRSAACIGLAIALLAQMPARAQITLDVSKVTFEQFWLRKIANPEKIAI